VYWVWQPRLPRPSPPFGSGTCQLFDPWQRAVPLQQLNGRGFFLLVVSLLLLLLLTLLLARLLSIVVVVVNSYGPSDLNFKVKNAYY
jgi:hypothetical protein